MNEKHTVRSLAADALADKINQRLTRLMLDSESIFQSEAPELWSQYREGLITSSEALLKLVTHLQETYSQ